MSYTPPPTPQQRTQLIQLERDAWPGLDFALDAIDDPSLFARRLIDPVDCFVIYMQIAHPILLGVKADPARVRSLVTRHDLALVKR